MKDFRDLKFLNEETYLHLCTVVVEIKKMLSSLINKIKSYN